jgi:type I restriction enzyme S subunit
MREYIKHPKLGKIPSSWKGSKLSEIVDLEHGFQFRKEDFTDSGIPVIKINNIIGNDLNLDNLSFIEPSRLEEFSRFLIKKNDILMSLTGNIGRVIEVGLIQRDFVQNYRVGKFVPVNRNELYNRYIKYLLSSPLVLSQFFKFSNQSAQANFGKQDMDKVWVAIPTSLPEQQKIAEILSTVDAKIEIVDQQIAETQELKKGLMQQLLTKGIGHTEFKDSALGKIPKSWEVAKIQDLIDDGKIVSHLDGNHGGLYPKAEEFIHDGVPYISANCFLSNRVDFSKCKHLSMDRSLKFKKGVAKNGDVLFAHNATVGPVALLETDLDFVILSTTATYFRLDNKTIDAKYWMFFLSSPVFKNQYEKVMGQSTRNQVPITMQRSFFSVLPTFKEQKEISERISLVAQKLEVLSEKKATYQELKQGLMQQLLTGKVRV